MNLSRKNIIIIICYTIIVGVLLYISGIVAVGSFIFSIFFYSMLVYSVYAVYKKLRDRSFAIFDLVNYNDFFYAFLYRVGTFFTLFILIVGGFSYYQNEVSPATMPVYTISNGEKTVVFHAMSHIGTPEFYSQVKKSIETLKQNDYVLYFEGVRPGSEENQKAFDKALGIKLDQDTYAHMSKLYGLVNQDNSHFLQLVNEKDYNVDVSIDDIMEKYHTIKQTKGLTTRSYNEPIDVSKQLMKELAHLRENELKVLRYLNRGFMNAIVKSEGIQQTLQNQFANKELFEVILDKRNEVIADKILTSEDKNIVATYGLLHFEGIFDILKNHDIKWQIRKIDYLYPIK